MDEWTLCVLQLPDLKDAEAVQKFFLEEIQLGEELLAQGNACSMFFSCRAATSSSLQSHVCAHVSMLFVLPLTGDYEKGVDHLTNAIAVCGQPQQLLQVLQQTLPPPVFQMLLTKLPTISQVVTHNTHWVPSIITIPTILGCRCRGDDVSHSWWMNTDSRH